MLWWTLIVVVSLNYVRGGPVFATKGSTKICETEGCKLRSARILDYMDPNVNPCDDFYLFACGNFIKKSLGWTAWQDSAFLQGLQAFKDRVKYLLSQPISKSDSKPIQDVKQLYNVCIKEGKDPRGTEAIIDLLKDNGVLYMWPMNNDNWDAMKFDFATAETGLRKIPFVGNSILNIRVYPQSTYRLLMVGQPELINRILFKYDLNTTAGKLLYKKVIIGILSSYGINKNTLNSDSEAIVDLEAKLEKIISYEGRRRLLDYSIKDLSLLVNGIDWKMLRKKILGRQHVNSSYIMGQDKVFFQKLDTLLTNTPNRTIANYMFWHTILKLHLFFNKHPAAFNFPHKIRYSHPDWEEYATCEEIAAWSLPLAVSTLYMKNYLNVKTVEEVKDMAKNIIEEIKNTIPNYNWMDDDARRRLDWNYQNVEVFVASPEPLQNNSALKDYYKGLSVKSQYVFDILLDVGKWRDKQYRQILDERPIYNNASHWRIVMPELLWTSLLPNYFFHTLTIPEAMLLPPFFDTDVPFYSNYASLGYLVGSELLTRFDYEKMKYDIDGKLSSIEDNLVREKAKCFVDEYDQFEDKQLQIKMNGTKSLGQNIVDNGGFKMAYNAYRKKKHLEPSLPGLEQYNNYQMFMISAANMWCTNTISHPNTADIFRKSGDTTAQFRVNGPLMNLPDFQTLFNCPEGSKMSPAKKCSLL